MLLQTRGLSKAFHGTYALRDVDLSLDRGQILGLVDWKAMTRTAQEIADRLGMELDLSRTAAELSPPQRTELEIIRAVLSDCKLLILDEPTAALTDREAERLFSVIRTLKEKGTAILYVSHRLEEILTLTDRVIVLRNGRKVSTWETAQVTREQLIAAMTDSLEAHISHRPRSFGPALLKAEHISSRDGAVKDGEITAHAGEIVGLFGLGAAAGQNFWSASTVPVPAPAVLSSWTGRPSAPPPPSPA